MIGLFCFVLAVLASPFKSKLRLDAENAVLRHQLIVLRRRLHGRVRLTNHDRWFFVQPIPTVTATAKAIVTPVGDSIAGRGKVDAFLPLETSSGKPATADVLRKAML